MTLLIASIFFLNNIAYGMDLSGTAHLRGNSPFDKINEKEDKDRVNELLKAVQDASEKKKENKEDSRGPSISSTGVGDEHQANRNILEGILSTALRQGKIDPKEKERRLKEFDDFGKALSDDIDLEVDNKNVFLINGQKLIVVDGVDVLSTTEEGEQYASAGLRRGAVYITRNKFNEWVLAGTLMQKIRHEQDEVSHLLKQAENMGLSSEELSEYLKDPRNKASAKNMIQDAHKFAEENERLSALLSEASEDEARQSFKDKFLDMFRGRSKLLQAQRENALVRENGREVKVFRDNSLTQEFADFTKSLKLQKVRVVEESNNGKNKIYAVDDVNDNRFLVFEEEGHVYMIAVKAATLSTGEFFIETKDEQVLQGFKKAWDGFGSRKTGRFDEHKFLYASAFSKSGIEVLLNKVAGNPILRNLFALIIERSDELRLAGGFFLSDRQDAGGFYMPYLKLILWRAKHSIPSAGLIGHEAMHHLFSEDGEIYKKFHKYIEENHEKLLKELRHSPLYSYLSEKNLIDEVIAYLMDGIADGRVEIFQFGRLKYGDLKMFKQIIPSLEEYFPEELLLRFSDEDIIRGRFFDLLKELYKIRSENKGMDLKDALSECAKREYGKEAPSHETLLIVADFFKEAGDLKRAENIYKRLLDSSEVDMATKAIIRLGLIDLYVKEGDVPEAGKLFEVSKEELTDAGFTEDLIDKAFSMVIYPSEVLAILLSVTDAETIRDIFSHTIKAIESKIVKVKEKLQPTTVQFEIGGRTIEWDREFVNPYDVNITDEKTIRDSVTSGLIKKRKDHDELLSLLNKSAFLYYLSGDNEKYESTLKEVEKTEQEILMLEEKIERRLEEDREASVNESLEKKKSENEFWDNLPNTDWLRDMKIEDFQLIYGELGKVEPVNNQVADIVPIFGYIEDLSSQEDIKAPEASALLLEVEQFDYSAGIELVEYDPELIKNMTLLHKRNHSSLFRWVLSAIKNIIGDKSLGEKDKKYYMKFVFDILKTYLKNTILKDRLSSAFRERLESLGLSSDAIGSIIERGALSIEDGQVRGNMDILKLIAEIEGVKVGDVLRRSLFHERAHDILELLLKEDKKDVLKDVKDGLGSDYYLVKAIMEEEFGEFESEQEFLEELVVKYYTYRFSGSDTSIFEKSEMLKVASVIDSLMPDGLKELFTIKGENTQHAQSEKLKELSRESKRLGGKLEIEFEEGEAIKELSDEIKNVIASINMTQSAQDPEEAVSINETVLGLGAKMVTLRDIDLEEINRLRRSNIDKFVIERKPGLEPIINSDTRDQQNWPYTYSDLNIVDSNFGIDIFDMIEKKSDSEPDKTFTVVDWGCGAGIALNDIAKKLKEKGINNVRLIGFADQYHSAWEKADESITFILDEAKALPKYRDVLKSPYLIYSFMGLRHLIGKNIDDHSDYSDYIMELTDNLSKDGKIITEYDRSKYERVYEHIKSDLASKGIEFEQVINPVRGSAMIISKEDPNKQPASSGKIEEPMIRFIPGIVDMVDLGILFKKYKGNLFYRVSDEGDTKKAVVFSHDKNKNEIVRGEWQLVNRFDLNIWEPVYIPSSTASYGEKKAYEFITKFDELIYKIEPLNFLFPDINLRDIRNQSIYLRDIARNHKTEQQLLKVLSKAKDAIEDKVIKLALKDSSKFDISRQNRIKERLKSTKSDFKGLYNILSDIEKNLNKKGTKTNIVGKLTLFAAGVLSSLGTMEASDISGQDLSQVKDPAPIVQYVDNAPNAIDLLEQDPKDLALQDERFIIDVGGIEFDLTGKAMREVLDDGTTVATVLEYINIKDGNFDIGTHKDVFIFHPNDKIIISPAKPGIPSIITLNTSWEVTPPSFVDLGTLYIKGSEEYKTILTLVTYGMGSLDENDIPAFNNGRMTEFDMAPYELSGSLILYPAYGSYGTGRNSSTGELVGFIFIDNKTKEILMIDRENYSFNELKMLYEATYKGVTNIDEFETATNSLIKRGGSIYNELRSARSYILDAVTNDKEFKLELLDGSGNKTGEFVIFNKGTRIDMNTMMPKDGSKGLLNGDSSKPVRYMKGDIITEEEYQKDMFYDDENQGMLDLQNTSFSLKQPDLAGLKTTHDTKSRVLLESIFDSRKVDLGRYAVDEPVTEGTGVNLYWVKDTQSELEFFVLCVDSRGSIILIAEGMEGYDELLSPYISNDIERLKNKMVEIISRGIDNPYGIGDVILFDKNNISVRLNNGQVIDYKFRSEEIDNPDGTISLVYIGDKPVNVGNQTFEKGDKIVLEWSDDKYGKSDTGFIIKEIVKGELYKDIIDTQDKKSEESKIGDKEVHSLIAVLRAGDYNKIIWAKKMLLQMGDIAVDQLIEALSDSSIKSNVLSSIIDILGNVGDPKAIQPLLISIEKQSNYFGAYLAAKAVFKIDEEKLSTIFQALANRAKVKGNSWRSYLLFANSLNMGLSDHQKERYSVFYNGLQAGIQEGVLCIHEAGMDNNQIEDVGIRRVFSNIDEVKEWINRDYELGFQYYPPFDEMSNMLSPDFILQISNGKISMVYHTDVKLRQIVGEKEVEEELRNIGFIGGSGIIAVEKGGDIGNNSLYLRVFNSVHSHSHPKKYESHIVVPSETDLNCYKGEIDKRNELELEDQKKDPSKADTLAESTYVYTKILGFGYKDNEAERITKMISDFYMENNISVLENLPELEQIKGLKDILSGNLEIEFGLPTNLEEVFTGRKANCYGSSQLFKILGEMIGLDITPLEIIVSNDKQLHLSSHGALLVNLSNGTSVIVDMALPSMGENGISDAFSINMQYKKEGNYLILNDNVNPLNLYYKFRIGDIGLINSWVILSNVHYPDSYTIPDVDSNNVKIIEKAIEKDPLYIRSYFGLANAYCTNILYANVYSEDDIIKWVKDNPENIEKALKLMDKALGLDPKNEQGLLYKNRLEELLEKAESRGSLEVIPNSDSGSLMPESSMQPHRLELLDGTGNKTGEFVIFNKGTRVKPSTMTPEDGSRGFLNGNSSKPVRYMNGKIITEEEYQKDMFYDGGKDQGMIDWNNIPSNISPKVPFTISSINSYDFKLNGALDRNNVASILPEGLSVIPYYTGGGVLPIGLTVGYENLFGNNMIGGGFNTIGLNLREFEAKYGYMLDKDEYLAGSIKLFGKGYHPLLDNTLIAKFQYAGGRHQLTAGYANFLAQFANKNMKNSSTNLIFSNYIYDYDKNINEGFDYYLNINLNGGWNSANSETWESFLGLFDEGFLAYSRFLGKAKYALSIDDHFNAYGESVLELGARTELNNILMLKWRLSPSTKLSGGLQTRHNLDLWSSVALREIYGSTEVLLPFIIDLELYGNYLEVKGNYYPKTNFLGFELTLRTDYIWIKAFKESYLSDVPRYGIGLSVPLGRDKERYMPDFYQFDNRDVFITDSIVQMPENILASFEEYPAEVVPQDPAFYEELKKRLVESGLLRPEIPIEEIKYHYILELKASRDIFGLTSAEVVNNFRKYNWGLNELLYLGKSLEWDYHESIFTTPQETWSKEPSVCRDHSAFLALIMRDGMGLSTARAYNLIGMYGFAHVVAVAVGENGHGREGYVMVVDKDKIYLPGENGFPAIKYENEGSFVRALSYIYPNAITTQGGDTFFGKILRDNIEKPIFDIKSNKNNPSLEEEELEQDGVKEEQRDDKEIEKQEDKEQDSDGSLMMPIPLVPVGKRNNNTFTDIPKRSTANSMSQIEAVFADTIIGNEEKFEDWLRDKRNAGHQVVIISEPEDFKNIEKYKEIAYIKVLGEDIKDESYINKLRELRVLCEFKPFSGFNFDDLLQVESNLDQYKEVLVSVAGDM
ncbi:MAG: hypothetical protein ABIG92_00545 [Candidatus Omnitrophota bacterium]